MIFQLYFVHRFLNSDLKMWSTERNALEMPMDSLSVQFQIGAALRLSMSDQ